MPRAKTALRSLTPLVFLTAALLQSGCSSTRTLTDVQASAASESAAPTAARGDSDALEAALRTEIEDWLGVPHVYGGMSRSGVDCSGFVLRIYSDLLNIDLPRTTDQQKREGRSVMRTSLRAGDLVFFKPDPKTRHVGIMLNSTEFVHASGSRGVMISGIDESYWQHRYWLARRILPGSDMAATAPARATRDEAVRMSW
ncbi:MAG: hypothetical protein HKN17_01085 [Rhodothermales bacterium]|nr:hypothetical protein [Rhodothermales bacterium]